MHLTATVFLIPKEQISIIKNKTNLDLKERIEFTKGNCVTKSSKFNIIVIIPVREGNFIPDFFEKL